MESSPKLGHSPVALTGGAQPSDLTALHEKRKALQQRLTEIDQLLRDARDRQRFSSDAAGAAKALDDERTYLLELDGLMTRIRAVEGKLLLTRRACH
jgi:hypothetical protein